MASLAEMRKKSKNTADVAKKVASTLGQKNYGDDRFWQLEVDQAGNGSALIRFLPGPADGDSDDFFVRMFKHGFKGSTGKWYVENSLTTLGLQDPVSEYNTELWNSTTDDNGPERKQARDQKRKLSYISNILVINDPKNPDNNGKVFLFNYGQKIFDKINECLSPAEDESGIDDVVQFKPYDFWEGANFKLRAAKVAGYRNYDKSSFADQTPIADSDEKIQAIYDMEHSLKAEVATDKFKSYDELKKKLHEVIGAGAVKSAPTKTAADLDDDDDLPSFDTPASTTGASGGSDEDYFAALASGD